jgi:hypothetical protein
LISALNIGGRNGNSRGDRRRLASELPEAWRERAKAKDNEVLSVTITKRRTVTGAKNDQET